jgi:thiamine-phosphate pyrophosphorylase
MPKTPLLYYITDRCAFPGDERTRRVHLLDKIAEAVSHGIDYIQLRERDLSAREFESLAREAVHVIFQQSSPNQELKTALLINSRTDVALATATTGVHLRADDVSPEEVRAAWISAETKGGAGTHARENLPGNPVIAVSCHCPEEVAQAAAAQATFAVLAPIFEKKDAAIPAGLGSLRQACLLGIPVLALGGVTLQNTQSCLQAGAAGIAAIRLFQENHIAAIVRELRG